MIEHLPSSGMSLIAREIEVQTQTRAIATLQMNKPIMSAEIERAVNGALAQYKNRGKWKEWGLTYLRRQGACILLWGPPGCGKTQLAKYMAQRMKMGIKEIDLSTFGSKVPGENERNLEVIFLEGERDNKILLLDEADSVLWDRAKASDNQWMVAIINKLLVLIADYPHPIFLATNRRQDLDPAINRRILADVYVGPPTYEQRIQIWEQKIPKKYPFQPTKVQLQELAQADLTGAEIENTILEASGQCINDNKVPTFDIVCNVAKSRAAMIIARAGGAK